MELSPHKMSVIMCTYNRPEFLERSIESILSQTFEDFEFVLVNNGSTDSSFELCEYYQAKDKRIKLINIPINEGAAKGRNRGLMEASGEYITFVDDDDYCEPRMLQVLWELSQTYDADIALCGSWNNINGELEPYFIFDDTLVLNKVQALDELLLRKRYNVAPPTKLFRKKLFDGVTFKENVLVDDIHVIYKVFANADIVVANGEPLYSFRKHPNNMTHFIQSNRPSPEIIKEYLSAFKERTAYLSEKVRPISERAKYSELSYMLSMCNRIKNFEEIDYSKHYNEMLNEISDNYQFLINCPYTEEEEIKLLNTLMIR
ncbi:glycosyltransferase family 2 protein [Paenibacillus massiliensis]|uniref:glycosyltransferase family 2 protein n=1 Tax=Paenibacillus massiliensis TaxID=225917 RepID=UPI00037925F2|nr:glycosyltransferase family 2 protein [Paenibacillus massiliensis]